MTTVTFISVDGDRVHYHGIDTGPKDPILHDAPRREDGIYQIGDTLAVKVLGHSYWVGLYMSRGYSPARFDVFRVLEVNGARSYKVECIASFPVRKQ